MFISLGVIHGVANLAYGQVQMYGVFSVGRLWSFERLEDRIVPSSLPLSFEPNVGQTDPQVQFLSRGQGYGLFLTANEAVLNLFPSSPASSQGNAVLRTRIVGANGAAAVAGVDALGGKANYFIGNDPASGTRISRSMAASSTRISIPASTSFTTARRSKNSSMTSSSLRERIRESFVLPSTSRPDRPRRPGQSGPAYGRGRHRPACSGPVSER